MYSWKEYWAGIAHSYADDGAKGFSAVLHPDAPGWFNTTIDRLQHRAWRTGLRHCRIQPDSAVLDVGCGTGRWLRRYLEQQLRPVGLDATAGMLRQATVFGVDCPLAAGYAQRLPFRNAAFGLVSAVTVVQHLEYADQENALKEMARVLRPGGRLLLLDLIRGDGPHIFPRRPEDWISQAALAGLSLIEWSGQEYFVVDRAFVNCVQGIRKRLIGVRKLDSTQLPGQARLRGRNDAQSGLRRLYWATRHVTCAVSEWTEPIAEKICPDKLATHGLFIFEKRL